MSASKIKTYVRFVISIVLCQVAAAIGAFFTTPAIPTWYASLRKPALTPPNWLFAPVWTALYLMMAVSLFLVWNTGPKRREVRESIVIFCVQLGVNVFWSYSFFGLQSPALGLVVILALWLSILISIASFFRVSKIAALFLVPYLVWVSLATYLNYSVVMLNSS